MYKFPSGKVKFLPTSRKGIMPVSEIERLSLQDGYAILSWKAREFLFWGDKKQSMRRSMRKAKLSPVAFSLWISRAKDWQFKGSIEKSIKRI
jgi:hypothetical protein